jgi:signal transduction histidine kinase
MSVPGWRHGIRKAGRDAADADGSSTLAQQRRHFSLAAFAPFRFDNVRDFLGRVTRGGPSATSAGGDALAAVPAHSVILASEQAPMRWLFVVALVGFLLAALGYFYLNSRGSEVELHNRLIADLRLLSEQDARWNDELLNARLGLPPRPRSSAPSAEGLDEALGRVREHAHELGRPGIEEQVAPLMGSFQAKNGLMDRWRASAKSTVLAHANLNRSVDAAQLAVQEARTRGGRRSDDWARLETLLSLTAMVGQGAGAPSVSGPSLNLAALAAALKTASAGYGDVVSGATSAVGQGLGAVQRASEEESGLLNQIAQNTAGQRTRTLTGAANAELGETLGLQQVYEIYLAAYVASLIVLLAYAGWRLNRSYRVIDTMNRELAAAKDGLEQRVAERTTELTRAMSEIKQQESLLIQSEKLSSLGQMVAGIAHEINTPLAYVKSSVDTLAARVPLLGQYVEQSEKLLGMLQAQDVSEEQIAEQFARVAQISGELKRHNALEDVKAMLKDGGFGIGQITEIVTNLRNFSRLDRSKVARVDLREGIETTLQIARHALKGKTIKKAFGPVPPVTCMPSQINQVFMNLIVNAAQATSDAGGVIFIRTAAKDRDHVLVEIADNGKGIPADVLPRVFDPFFTTKEVGKGTGLGLSIVYKIVQQHGGTIGVTSKEGVGTRFTVVLPVAGEAAAAAAA